MSQNPPQSTTVDDVLKDFDDINMDLLDQDFMQDLLEVMPQYQLDDLWDVEHGSGVSDGVVSLSPAYDPFDHASAPVHPVSPSESFDMAFGEQVGGGRSGRAQDSPPEILESRLRTNRQPSAKKLAALEDLEQPSSIKKKPFVRLIVRPPSSSQTQLPTLEPPLLECNPTPALKSTSTSLSDRATTTIPPLSLESTPSLERTPTPLLERAPPSLEGAPECTPSSPGHVLVSDLECAPAPLLEHTTSSLEAVTASLFEHTPLPSPESSSTLLKPAPTPLEPLPTPLGHAPTSLEHAPAPLEPAPTPSLEYTSASPSHEQTYTPFLDYAQSPPFEHVASPLLDLAAAPLNPLHQDTPTSSPELVASPSSGDVNLEAGPEEDLPPRRYKGKEKAVPIILPGEEDMNGPTENIPRTSSPPSPRDVRLPPGRLSNEDQTIARDHFNSIMELFAAASLLMGADLSVDQVITLFLRSIRRTTSTVNGWNSYQHFFSANLSQELRRGGFDPDTPAADVKPSQRSLCWERFREQNKNWREILETAQAAEDACPRNITAACRQQHFDRSFQNMVHLAHMMFIRHNVDATIMMAGNDVKTDMRLAAVYSTQNSQNFFQERCQADELTMIAHFKAHVYHQKSLLSRPVLMRSSSALDHLQNAVTIDSSGAITPIPTSSAPSATIPTSTVANTATVAAPAAPLVPVPSATGAPLHPALQAPAPPPTAPPAPAAPTGAVQLPAPMANALNAVMPLLMPHQYPNTFQAPHNAKPTRRDTFRLQILFVLAARRVGVNLPMPHDTVQFPWQRLLVLLSRERLEITNWPDQERCPLPGFESSRKGLQGLRSWEMRELFRAFALDNPNRLSFIRYTGSAPGRSRPLITTLPVGVPFASLQQVGLYLNGDIRNIFPGVCPLITPDDTDPRASSTTPSTSTLVASSSGPRLPSMSLQAPRATSSSPSIPTSQHRPSRSSNKTRTAKSSRRSVKSSETVADSSDEEPLEDASSQTSRSASASTSSSSSLSPSDVQTTSGTRFTSPLPSPVIKPREVHPMKYMEVGDSGTETEASNPPASPSSDRKRSVDKTEPSVPHAKRSRRNTSVPVAQSSTPSTASVSSPPLSSLASPLSSSSSVPPSSSLSGPLLASGASPLMALPSSTSTSSSTVLSQSTPISPSRGIRGQGQTPIPEGMQSLNFIPPMDHTTSNMPAPTGLAPQASDGFLTNQVGGGFPLLNNFVPTPPYHQNDTSVFQQQRGPFNYAMGSHPMNGFPPVGPPMPWNMNMNFNQPPFPSNNIYGGWGNQNPTPFSVGPQQPMYPPDVVFQGGQGTWSDTTNGRSA